MKTDDYPYFAHSSVPVKGLDVTASDVAGIAEPRRHPSLCVLDPAIWGGLGG